jgi:hypothetical protein
MKNLELLEVTKPLVEQLRSLWKFSEDEMRGKDYQTKNDLRLIVLLQITGAASRIVSSVIGQIDGGAFYNLEMLLRPLVEGIINYKYIKEDKTQMRARAFIVDDLGSRIKNVRKITTSPYVSTISPQDIEGYKRLMIQLEAEKQEMIQQYGEDKLNFFSLQRRAELSGTFDMYVMLYWYLCQDTHMTSRGLDKYMKLDNGRLSISWDMDLGLFTKHIQSFYTLFLALLGECAEEFGIPKKEELGKFPTKI